MVELPALAITLATPVMDAAPQRSVSLPRTGRTPALRCARPRSAPAAARSARASRSPTRCASGPTLTRLLRRFDTVSESCIGEKEDDVLAGMCRVTYCCCPLRSLSDNNALIVRLQIFLRSGHCSEYFFINTVVVACPGPGAKIGTSTKSRPGYTHASWWMFMPCESVGACRQARYDTSDSITFRRNATARHEKMHTYGLRVRVLWVCGNCQSKWAVRTIAINPKGAGYVEATLVGRRF